VTICWQKCTTNNRLQRGSLQHLCVGTGQTGVCHRSDLCTPVRPVKVTGQTFAGVNRRKTSEPRPGRILSHPDLRANPNARIHVCQDQVIHASTQ
jgi:hypothetical protein